MSDKKILKEWAVVLSYKNPFLPPEANPICLAGKVYGHPRFDDGHSVRTSPVIGANGREISTESGSVYLLEGSPEQEYLDYLQSIGKEYDADNPIKTRK